MKTTLLMGLMLVLAVACGKDKKSNSSSNVFGNQIGVAQAVEGYVVMPVAGYGGQLYIEAGGRQYQLGQVSPQAGQVLNQMAQGMYRPSSQNSHIVKFRSRITAALSGYGYGNGGYSVGGYQPQPTQSNMLDVQSIQPY
jgi:hypothetical protein